MALPRSSVVAVLLVQLSSSGCALDVVSDDESGDAFRNGDAFWNLVVEPECIPGREADCVTPSGGDGTRECLVFEDGVAWSDCEPVYDEPDCSHMDYCQAGAYWTGTHCECNPYDEPDCSHMGHCLQGAYWTGTHCECDPTPLVLSFHNAPVRYQTPETPAFDLIGDGTCPATDWPTWDTPWLALDRNGNGRIDDAGELFGSATRLSTGTVALHGFASLAELDANGDGWITDEDPGWGALLLWTDLDGNQASELGELAQVAAQGIAAIELGYVAGPPVCDTRGNCEIERADMFFFGRSGRLERGSVVDIHLAVH